ncbi:hypothetical protein HGQ17_11325 [Nesterenkonia sp. MY13]|uniref:Uncharacterized protein n=1 Tax=Nesterenkonia sedimenti TaxID=1463632 RepID=A0A7X8YEJ7_9MICC|nr:hypothetical protein [Nesterenkonia sedimenti]NLS10570.1 hypothetical protein [Nesterenkonia sedimenti]
MVIQTERGQAEEQIVAALRAVFDASVMNFGSYNLLFATNEPGAQPGETVGEGSLSEGPSAQEEVQQATHLLVGYRREPAEMVLCPVDLNTVLPPNNDDDAVAPKVPVLVNMTNLAGMAAQGSSVEIALSTGRRVKLDIQPEVVFEQTPQTPLHQGLDVEDFYSFLDHFMDTVER